MAAVGFQCWPQVDQRLGNVCAVTSWRTHLKLTKDLVRRNSSRQWHMVVGAGKECQLCGVSACLVKNLYCKFSVGTWNYMNEFLGARQWLAKAKEDANETSTYPAMLK